ncbi:HlyD family secretion protein [Rhodobacter capsulatus]|uniref:HlyD family secretion protein n=1 Tax=Rhodobacter capsulatus TaxID=1061 RepID=UPI0040388CD1
MPWPQADAALAQARLQVAQLRAAYNLAQAQEQVAQDTADYLASELKRQEAITGRGAGTESALDAARHDASSALESLAAAKQGVAAALAALGGDPKVETDTHPTVMAALTARDKAAYNLGLTEVKAPADGVIYKADSFKPGQFVAAGAALFSLVETGDTWIEANFKETQIGKMAPGQKAEVEFDTFPGKEFEAVVEAVGAGTGGGIFAAAGAKRHRQLGQGHPARAGHAASDRDDRPARPAHRAFGRRDRRHQGEDQSRRAGDAGRGPARDRRELSHAGSRSGQASRADHRLPDAGHDHAGA